MLIVMLDVRYPGAEALRICHAKYEPVVDPRKCKRMAPHAPRGLDAIPVMVHPVSGIPGPKKDRGYPLDLLQGVRHGVDQMTDRIRVDPVVYCNLMVMYKDLPLQGSLSHLILKRNAAHCTLALHRTS